MGVAAQILGLCEEFLTGKLEAPVFERKFYEIYKQSSGGNTPEVAEVLGELFACCDAFEPDRSLWREGDFDIDEHGLRKAVEHYAPRLRVLVRGENPPH